MLNIVRCGIIEAMSNLDTLRYRYLAYFVIRDAIGFYFGIPKFMDSLNTDKLINDRLKLKLKDNPDADEKQIERYKRLIDKSVKSRVAYLSDDYEHCKDVLFNDNVWLQLLDIDTEFFQTYLNKLPQETKDELAIVPSWTIRDDSLRRPYLNSEKAVREIKF